MSHHFSSESPDTGPPNPWFVLDPDRYQQADLKMGTVHSVRWEGDRGEIHYSGRFRGFSFSVDQALESLQKGAQGGGG